MLGVATRRGASWAARGAPAVRGRVWARGSWEQQQRSLSSFMDSYQKHVDERAQLGIVPKPLSAEQCSQLVEQLRNPEKGEEEALVHLLESRVPPGVDEAAYVKAGYLAAIAKGEEPESPLVSKKRATELLGTMVGGYNIAPLMDLLDDKELGPVAAKGLKKTLLMFDAFHDVEEKAKAGNALAKEVIEAWANAEWFDAKPKVREKMTVTIFKVPGETNTDDLSPAPDAFSRPDIPLHALAMLKYEREGIHDAMAQITELKEKGHPLAYCGDVVGTGSSRKSAINSVLWHMGLDIPYVPNKRTGGVVIGSKIAPIFFNTAEDSGAFPIEIDVSNLEMGRVVDIFPYEGVCKDHETGEVLAEFKVKSEVLFDEVQAGGRIPLIIGRGLTAKARESLGLPSADFFRVPGAVEAKDGQGYTLAQKMVGEACGLPGVLPNSYCEPKMTTVGSQDTTGPMTRDELKDLACLGFQADLVMQSFCHTAAYPKPVDVVTHHTLPDFIRNRGGISLKPGDGIIHSWLNRMLLPDTVGTGGDSHTRFPIGISFPAGSGLVAFAAATGVMPLDMPESVRVRFHGTMQPGITLRDLVHAIPYYAIQQGHLTVEKRGKKNVFSGRTLEIEGLPDLKCEQAFELSDASAERSAAGCTIELNEEPVIEYLKSNIVMLNWMISEGYGDTRTIERRIKKMEDWLANPKLLRADKHADYHTTIDIDLNEIKEPILCAPNDPDDARLLSEVQGDKVDEVFIGSCMTNISHFRAAGRLLSQLDGEVPTRLWVSTPTKMDEKQLMDEGYFANFASAGARHEMSGCSLCMGNQARVRPGATVVSTSTRNFPNRLGKGANVYLSSSEVAAVSAILGRIPTPEEYVEKFAFIQEDSSEIHRFLNFNEIEEYVEAAKKVAKN